jgi:hypothetical protein
LGSESKFGLPGFFKSRKKDEICVKKLALTLSLMLSASAFAQNNTVVRWPQITGVITAPGVDNPVGGTTDANGNKTNQIHSGAGPWTTRGGSARVNLATGEGSFDVEGLVLNGGNAGTLVCNPGTPSQAIVDTAAVDLSSQGNAELSFRLNVPAGCASPLFLIRVP